MTFLTDPADLSECECNGHGLYALPEAVFARVVAPDSATRPAGDDAGVMRWSISRLFPLGSLNGA